MRRYLTAALTAAMLVGLLPLQAVAGETPQTISFDLSLLPATTYGDAPFDISSYASSDSTLAVEFTSLTGAVCTVAGTMVAIVAAGDCTIRAAQGGDDTYAPAIPVEQTFSVGKATLTVTASSPAAGTYGDPAPAITPGYAGFVGTDTALVLDTAPTCTTAYVKGNAPNTYATSCSGGVDNDYAFSYVAGTFSVGKATLTVTASSPAAGTYGDPAPAITPGYAGFVGTDTALVLDTAPTCTTAYVKGNAPNTYATSCSGGVDNDYAFSYVAGTFSVGKATLTVTASSPAAGTYGDPAPAITPGYAGFVGTDTALVLDTAPTCTTAYVKGNAPNTYATSCSGGVDNDYAFSYVAGTFSVGKATLTVTASSPAAGTYGDPAPAITPGYAGFVGTDTALVLDTAPTCTTAYVKGNAPNTYATSCSGGVDNDYAFSYVAGTFSVGKATLTVTASSPAAGTYGDPAPAITPGYAGFVGTDTALVLDTAPTCTTAYVKGNAPNTYATSCSGGVDNDYAFSYVAGTFSVGKATQAISFTSTAPGGAVVGGATYTVTASATSSLAPVLSIDASSVTVCSISGSIVSFIGKGNCRINADQSGNANYNAAPQVHQSFGVGVTDQTITFLSTAPVGAVFGQTYAVAASATSGLAVTLTIDPVSSAVCSISGPTVSFTGTGTCTINANQAGDGTWNIAPQVQQSFSVGRADQTVSFTSTAPGSAIIGQTYVVSAAATSGLGVTFTSAAPSICTVSGTLVSLVARGECLIDAFQAGNANWNAASQRQGFGVGDQAPYCPDVSASAVMNIAKSGTAGCTDPELDALSYAIVGDGLNGHATIDSAGTWTYAPAANFTGSDTFTFKANDGILDSNVATIRISVTNAVLDARNDAVPFVRPLDPTVVSVLANDSPGVGDTGQPMTITAVTNGAKGRASTDGATVTYDPSGCAVGTDTFTYTVSDGQYSATKTVFLTIARPGQNGLSSMPITDTPTLGFVTNSTVGATVPARLSWCGVTRTGTSIRSYRIRQSTNGGVTYAKTPIISGTRTSSSTRNLSVGATYRWVGLTTDSAGRAGAYKASLASRVARYQENSAFITYTPGAWARAVTSSASGGAETYTYTAGAVATFTLTNARQFAIVGPRSAKRGSFEVWVDGAKVATVSEKATKAVYRRVLYVRGLVPGTHTIQVIAVGNGRIDLDAILALS